MIHLVQEYGPKRWTLISKHLKGRTGKQCRERYMSHLYYQLWSSCGSSYEYTYQILLFMNFSVAIVNDGSGCTDGNLSQLKKISWVIKIEIIFFYFIKVCMCKDFFQTSWALPLVKVHHECFKIIIIRFIARIWRIIALSQVTSFCSKCLLVTQKIFK